MAKPIQDVIVAAFGMATSILTALLLVYVQSTLNFGFYTLTYFFVLPVGAGISGFAAASGYFFGARLFNHKPSGLILLNMVFVSLATYLVVKYFGYISTTVDGRSINAYIPFTKYLDITIRSTSLRLLRSTSVTGELGGWGYLVALIQVGGFAFGGVVVFFFLDSIPYCETCSRYFLSKGKRIQYLSSQDSLINLYQRITARFNVGKLQEAITIHSEAGDAKQKKHEFRSQMHLKYCKGCSQHLLNFLPSVKSGDDWKDVEELELGAFSDTQLEV